MPEHEVFQEQTLEVTTTGWWWPSTFAWTESASQKHPRLKFDLEKLKHPNVLETFQAMTGGKLAPFTIMNNGDTDMDLMITTFNTAVTETASEILGKHRQKRKKKPWVTAEILDLYD